MSERKTVRQDYILRVRYRNTLPPPAFEPKLLRLNQDLQHFYEASYLSSLIHEQPPTVELDSEMGMPIDLSIIPGVYEGNDSAMLAPGEIVDLDAKDRAITKSTNEAQSNKLSTDVSFLRRTQYISSEIGTTSKLKPQETERLARLASSLQAELEPHEQLAGVERTFSSANESLSSLQHPTKRELKAIQAWPILPDFEHFEQQYVNAKFPTNPAPKAQSMVTVRDEDERLEVACLVPRIIDENSNAPENDYIAYFLPDLESATQIHRANFGETDSSNQVSKYHFVREYDAKKEESAAEWAISMHADGLAHYIELNGRMNMRGRRRGGQVTDTHEVVEMGFKAAA